MYIGGLDIGTSGCKIAVYDENGKFVKCEYTEYDVKRSNGLHEIDPEEILLCVKKVISELNIFDLAAIAVTSFGETFVMLDESDKPCAPSMLYTDPRGKDECAKLSTHFGEQSLAYITGTKPHEMYSLPKIMWIKNNLPRQYAAAQHILLIQDYIVYMLTGAAQIDYSLAARTICFDIENKCWSEDILDYCGIDKKLLSNPVPSGTVAGEIKREIADELSINPNLKIVSGCHDQIAAMTGANIFNCGDVMDGTGTVECVPVVMDGIPKEPSLFDCGFSFVPHINGKYACYALSYTGGATLKWFRDNFSDKSYAQLDKDVSNLPTDLLIMPHFAGAATPYMDMNSKAAVIGLTFEHTKADIYKALMEGTAYEIAVNIEVLKRYKLSPKKLVATGGGARSSVWLQIKADVLGVPVAALDTEEVGAAGTAYLAGRAAKIYDSDMQLAHTKITYCPNNENHKFYLKQFEKYEKIYNFSKQILS